jgi:adenylate kinase
MFNIIILGPPGCGKGTQSANIINKYRLTHISTGEILREEIELHTAIGEVVKKFIDRGYLVPDDIIMREIFVSAIRHKPRFGLLFDGFPRTLFQADYLDDLLKHKKQKISLVIYLEVSEEELYNRIKHRSKVSKRSDDNFDTVKNRLDVYYELTHPLIAYYTNQKKLVSISGMAPVEEVFSKISSVIDDYLIKKEK